MHTRVAIKVNTAQNITSCSMNPVSEQAFFSIGPQRDCLIQTPHGNESPKVTGAQVHHLRSAALESQNPEELGRGISSK